jgi:ribosome-associated heat shock protein Hsp15
VSLAKFLRMESVRVDRWLYAVRVFKTRTLAANACEGGHVEVNSKTVKPATQIHVGERVVVRVEGNERILEVVQLIDKRVSAPTAATCFTDHSPIREPEPFIPVFVRDAGAGRPTKRDRRDLDRLRAQE